MVKNPLANAGDAGDVGSMWVQSLGGEDLLGKEMATHEVFLPGKFYGQRSLAGYSPWGHNESDMT